MIDDIWKLIKDKETLLQNELRAVKTQDKEDCDIQSDIEIVFRNFIETHFKDTQIDFQITVGGDRFDPYNAYTSLGEFNFGCGDAGWGCMDCHSGFKDLPSILIRSIIIDSIKIK